MTAPTETGAGVADRPCAAPGLLSYRYAGRYGWVMIGARDDSDAIVQAGRSVTDPIDPSRLQKWSGSGYTAIAKATGTQP